MTHSKQHSKSSKQWLREHFNDKYVKRAQQEGLRARSAYKLTEIDERYKIIKPGMNVVDLGAAPGSWSEYVAKKIGERGKIIALDILPIVPIKNVTFLQGDFMQNAIVDQVLQLIGANKVDVVLSDMAPNTSGIPDVDQVRSLELVRAAFYFAVKVLKQHGIFLAKIFQSQDVVGFIKEARCHFREIKTIKPEASRARSQEVFLLMKDFVLEWSSCNPNLDRR
jgi:23S rRNA (uridine2552-2'-O)-methyltransferase